MTQPGSGSHIVILRGGALGDCVISTPAISALRRAYPGSHITLVAEPFSADVFRHSADIDELLVLYHKDVSVSEYFGEMFRLRRRGVDLLVDMHSGSRSFVQTMVIGGRQRIGFPRRIYRKFVYTDRVPFLMNVHAVQRQAELLRPLGLDLGEEGRRLHIYVTNDERAQARQLLAAAGLGDSQPYVVMHATAGSGRQLKQWLPDRFAELADQLGSELGASVVMLGHSSDDRAMVDSILAAARRPIVNLFDRTSVRTMIAVLEGARMCVGLDSGPMHVAAALQVPLVAIFGPADPAVWGPWTESPFRIVRAGLPCSPCDGRECSFQVRCMTSIQVSDVMNAVRQVRP